MTNCDAVPEHSRWQPRGGVLALAMKSGWFGTSSCVSSTLATAFVVLTVLGNFPVLGGDGGQENRINLRERFGFDPLKRTPLVVIYRMDLAGNNNGILEDEEIPEAAREYVAQLMEEAQIERTRAVRLHKIALSWQIRAEDAEPRQEKSFAIHRAAALKNTPPLPDSRVQARQFLGLYDEDGSGSLERHEWRNLGEEWDLDGDARLTFAEVASRFASYEEARFRSAANHAPIDEHHGKADPKKSDVGDEMDHHDVPRSNPDAFRFRRPHERLPAGVPAWYVELDVNRDGQVMMSEFASQWTDERVKQFYEFDLNGDGVITPRECISASER